MGKRGPAPQPVPLKILKGRGHGLDQAGLPIPAVPKFERAHRSRRRGSTMMLASCGRALRRHLIGLSC